MQAIIQDRYGSAEVLEARDIDRPAIAEDEVLVRVRAASVHVGDCVPYVMRMGTGLSKPKNPVPGPMSRGRSGGLLHFSWARSTLRRRPCRAPSLRVAGRAELMVIRR